MAELSPSIFEKMRWHWALLIWRIGRAVPAIVAAILPTLFLYFYLVLVQEKFWLVDEGTWTVPLRTETAFFVYGVMLAGMVGSLLKHSVLKAASQPNDDQKTQFLDLATYLFVGALAAFSVAVLLPTALLLPAHDYVINSRGERIGISREIDPFAAVNKWGLIVLAASVGYGSREALGDFARTIRRLFDAAPSIANIEERVEAGLKKAIAPPPFINFNGILGLGLREVSQAWVSTGPSAQVFEGGRYQIVVFIVGKSRRDLPNLFARSPIAITDGIDGNEVTFDLAVDTVTAGAKFLRQSVTLDTRSADEEIRFDFVPQIQDPLEASTDVGFAPGEGRREAYIQVSLYQGAVYCADVRMKLSILSEGRASKTL